MAFQLVVHWVVQKAKFKICPRLRQHVTVVSNVMHVLLGYLIASMHQQRVRSARGERGRERWSVLVDKMSIGMWCIISTWCRPCQRCDLRVSEIHDAAAGKKQQQNPHAQRQVYPGRTSMTSTSRVPTPCCVLTHGRDRRSDRDDLHWTAEDDEELHYPTEISGGYYLRGSKLNFLCGIQKLHALANNFLTMNVSDDTRSPFEGDAISSNNSAAASTAEITSCALLRREALHRDGRGAQLSCLVIRWQHSVKYTNTSPTRQSDDAIE